MLYPAELRGHMSFQWLTHSWLAVISAVNHSRATHRAKTTMASINKRLSWNRKTVNRARVRLKAHPPQVALFPKLADAQYGGE
jgi:hypothetical protein